TDHRRAPCGLPSVRHHRACRRCSRRPAGCEAIGRRVGTATRLAAGLIATGRAPQDARSTGSTSVSGLRPLRLETAQELREIVRQAFQEIAAFLNDHRRRIQRGEYAAETPETFRLHRDLGLWI